MMRAAIDARRAALASVRAGHNAFIGVWPGMQAALAGLPEFQPLLDMLVAASKAHADSEPLITAEVAKWDAAIADDDPPPALHAV